MIKLLKSENGGVTVFVIIAFLFIMTMLISMYMNNVNYQITTLQAEERLKEVYGRDVNNANVILANMFSYNITFNANGGTVETENVRVNYGNAIGDFPKCTNGNNGLLGWFTKREGGEEITSSTILTSDMELFAHWTSNKTKIGDNEFNTLAEAINELQQNNVSTETTIVLLADTQVGNTLEIKSGRNIVIDAQNYTITNTGNNQIVNNKGGILHIKNGTLLATGTNAAIDNQSGATLIITGGRIISTGGKAAVYNNGGTVEISGDAYLESNASGVLNGVPRATVQNCVNNGKITITGGTIIGTNGPGISNNGTLTIGTKLDGNVSISSPLIVGSTYGVVNLSGKTFKFYDGIFKGVSRAIDGTPSELEDNYRVDDTSTEVIDTTTYHTAYLVPDV